MPYLATAVAAVAALGLVNLVLTLAVIRRLRQHADLLSNPPGSAGAGVIAAGGRPAEFAAVDVDGLPVPGDGPRLVGFFSPECEPCKAALPAFVTLAAEYPQGRTRVLAVVASDGSAEVTDFTSDLSTVAQVVVEPTDGPVSTAFQVSGYPAWCMLDELGVVQRSGVGLDDLPVPAPR